MVKFKRKKIVAGAAAAALAVVGVGVAQPLIAQSPLFTLGGGAPSFYRADFTALNYSNAAGYATVMFAGDRRSITVHIVARGLERGGPHLSHIHGASTVNGRPTNSRCPSFAQDSDHDRFVELAEGQVTYGPILVDFMNIDPNEDGQVDFVKTIQLTGSENITPLTLREIVIHGRSVGAVGAGTPGEVDGTAGFKAVLPVLCGDLRQVSGGVR